MVQLLLCHIIRWIIPDRRPTKERNPLLFIVILYHNYYFFQLLIYIFYNFLLIISFYFILKKFSDFYHFYNIIIDNVVFMIFQMFLLGFIIIHQNICSIFDIIFSSFYIYHFVDNVDNFVYNSKSSFLLILFLCMIYNFYPHNPHYAFNFSIFRHLFVHFVHALLILLTFNFYCIPIFIKKFQKQNIASIFFYKKKLPYKTNFFLPHPFYKIAIFCPIYFLY